MVQTLLKDEAPARHLTWQNDPLVDHVRSAIRELSAVNDRIVLLGIQSGSLEVKEAASFIGAVVNKVEHVGLAHNRRRVLAPTSDCTAIGMLWAALDDVRTKVIDAQLEAEGFHPRGSWQSGEADLERFAELEAEAVEVWEVV